LARNPATAPLESQASASHTGMEGRTPGVSAGVTFGFLQNAPMKVWHLLMGVALTTHAGWANGGGYFRGGLKSAGDVQGFEPQATENIRILDEKLTIALGASQADVEVRYLMRNETAKRVTVRFGFPVEEAADRDLMMTVGDTEKLKVQGRLQYCRNYQIAAAGVPVKVTWQPEQQPADSRSRFVGIAGWLISELTFGPNEEKPVRIAFQSDYPKESWSVSENTTRSARIFKYRLSTAACWAGTIGTGRIVLKPAGIPAEELKVLKPVNRFRKQGDDWVWDFQDLEPSLADDLEIEAVPEIRSFGRSVRENDSASPFVTYVERSGRWTMAHSNYSITASSTLPRDEQFKYDADNLKSRAYGVWSEGAPGSGKGEWLELKPEVPKPLDAIEITPGYAPGGKLFGANARPRNVSVELNGEHRFEVEVPDSPDEYRIPVVGYAKPVKTIRLTFGDVWEGSQFEDLCMTSIQLHVRLDKKPKITPSR